MQYPCVITLPDQKNETLFSLNDFEYLIDKYMGYDALRYFRSVREEKNSKEDALVRHSYEMKKAISVLNNRIEELESDFDA